MLYQTLVADLQRHQIFSQFDESKQQRLLLQVVQEQAREMRERTELLSN